MRRVSARALAVGLLLCAPVALAEGPGSPEGAAPDAALRLLKEANPRYATSAVHPRHDRAERPRLAKGGDEGMLGVPGGVYDLASGRVEWLAP